MITIANPEKYVVGLYERLSNEKIEVGNGEVIEINEDEKESGSISTQKIFNENFCKDNNIQIYKHYADDGYSGATFDRPDFNRMLQDIENKKINLVIVKDLSRFGRLSSKISYYLDEFFNKKDPLDKNHYIIDQDIAPIVRRIFILALNGMTPTEIGKILTNEKTLVPSEIVGNSHLRTDDELKRGWNRNTVKRILQNVTYLGWVSNGNAKKINYKSKKIMIIPKEDRIIVKGIYAKQTETKKEWNN